MHGPDLCLLLWLNSGLGYKTKGMGKLSTYGFQSSGNLSLGSPHGGGLIWVGIKCLG